MNIEITTSLIAAVATIIAAIIAARASLKTVKASIENQRINEIHLEKLKKVEGLINHTLHVSNHNFTKKVEVLSTAYSYIGRIKYYVERYLTPYTEYQPENLDNFLLEACKEFENFRKFYLENSLYFDAEEALGKTLNDIMGSLNHLNNIKKNKNGIVDDKEFEIFWEKIAPATHRIREEFKEVLGIKST